MNQIVAVLGASNKKQRYSNQAIRLLGQNQHQVIPVNPAFNEIEGWECKKELQNISPPIDTLTLYMGPERLEEQLEAILALKPRRVLFNPGTESEKVQSALTHAGIPWLEDCTLVMLRNNRF